MFLNLLLMTCQRKHRMLHACIQANVYLWNFSGDGTMGAHFSPCGRFLAACVAYVLPNMETDHGFHGLVHRDTMGAATSTTRYPISAHLVLHELQIYSLYESMFSSVLASRIIIAAHCLTLIQIVVAAYATRRQR